MASNSNELDGSCEEGPTAKKIKLGNDEETTRVTDESQTMKYKLSLAEPYNIFYSKIPKANETMDASNTITFSDLLCPSLGKLNKSLQINFGVNLPWLIEQYKTYGLENKPLTILYDGWFSDVSKAHLFPNIKCHSVEKKDPYGTHHTKIGLYFYEDKSVRVVVSTANLYYDDWNYYNQSLWISPACPKLADDLPDDEGCGVTEFKKHLLEYLNSYQLDALNEWTEIVKRTDFSDIKVFLITSVPGHHDSTSTRCHINRVGSLLSKYCEIPKEENWQVIAQASSFGSLGTNTNDWWKKCFLRSLNAIEPHVAIIYPSVNNASNNYFEANGINCLAYQRNTHNKQLWIKQYLHTWKADQLGRSRAMPHTKSYCQINGDHSRMAYYLLTSANISKAAWGDQKAYVKSYEAGVLFLPKLFKEKYFLIHKKENENSHDKIFPVMFDLPLERYLQTDEPFTK